MAGCKNCFSCWGGADLPLVAEPQIYWIRQTAQTPVWARAVGVHCARLIYGLSSRRDRRRDCPLSDQGSVGHSIYHRYTKTRVSSGPESPQRAQRINHHSAEKTAPWIPRNGTSSLKIELSSRHAGAEVGSKGCWGGGVVATQWSEPQAFTKSCSDQFPS